MHADLERRLRAVYPSGEIQGLSEDALVSSERDERIGKALKFITDNTPLFCTPHPFHKPAYEFTFTQLDHPEFSSWVWQMDNAAKLNWIKKAGEPYPVLWLKISRIADFFDYFFNLWTPKDDTGPSMPTGLASHRTRPGHRICTSFRRPLQSMTLNTFQMNSLAAMSRL